jgi:hypothetical protein
MKVRIYYRTDKMYNPHGGPAGSFERVTGIVIINDDDFNLIETIQNGDDKFATFPLNEDIINLVMDGPDSVNMEEVKKYEGKF